MKKSFYLLIIGITFSSLLNLGLASAYAIGGPVFFMKTDSTAKIYTQFIFSGPGGTELLPTVHQFPLGLSDLGSPPVDSIAVVTDPNSFSVNQPNLNVTYTITAKNGITGTFGIFLGVPCAGGTWIPLVVGLNESEVDPKIFYSIYQPHSMFGCPPAQGFIQQINVVGYSDMVTKTVSENSTTWSTPIQSSTVPEFSFAEIVLALSIVSTILLYQFKSKIKI